MSSATADGRTLSIDLGETILDWLERHGTFVPHLCYHPTLGPLRTCDTCLVEVGGQLVRACATPVEAGMQIGAASPRARAAQMERLQRLLLDHQLYCTLCDKNNGDCAMHNTALRMGVDAHRFRPKPYPIDDSNPFFRYNPSQCILCGRCVEACQNLVVNEVLSIDWKRNPPRVVFDQDQPIDRSSCVSCGTCQTVCPVDAMIEKGMVGQASHLSYLPPETKDRLIALSTTALSNPTLWAVSEAEAKSRSGSMHRTKTVCTFCAVGCTFEVVTKGRRILQVVPRPESPANQVATCIKGKFGWDFVNSPNRLTRPLIRKHGRFVESSWDEAIGLVAERLLAIKRESGPNAIGVVASCNSTNEEAFLAQKFARQVLGTHNVDNCARNCQAPATMGLQRTVGIGADSGNFDQITAADLVVIIGSNTAEQHPVLAGKIKRQQKLRGQKLLVIDVRRHEMAQRADLFLSPHSGSDLAVLNAIARYLVEQGWQDRAFIEARTEAFDAWVESLRPFTLDFAESVSGVPIAELVRAAEMLHASKATCFLWAMGITQHGRGSDTSTAICNLALATGNFGRPGTGGYPLRGHCNVQGVSDFGALPKYFSGYQPTEDTEVVAKFERAWGPLPKEPGITDAEMTDKMLSGDLRALWVMGEDKVLADADQEKVRRALTEVDFFVYQDLFLTRSAQFADVILPAAASLEKEGTFVNTERRIQRLHRVFEPLGGSKTDFEIIQRVARAMGADWNYSSVKDVLEEAARLTPHFAGVRWDKLDGFRSQLWPVTAEGADSPYLYAERFALPGGKARFFPVAWTAPPATNREFDLNLASGRLLEHFHWGNMTMESDGIRAKVPQVFVEVSPELARARGLKDGDRVRLTGETGHSMSTRVLVTPRMQGSRLFLPLHNNRDETINTMSTDRRDPATQTPAYKEIPVKLELLESAPDALSPLPRNNPRHATRNPQPGVRVEEKWARPDYVPPSRSGGVR